MSLIIGGKSNCIYSELQKQEPNISKFCVMCDKQFKKADRVHQLVCNHLYHRGCLNERFGQNILNCVKRDCRQAIEIDPSADYNIELYHRFPEEAIAVLENRLSIGQAQIKLQQNGMDSGKAEEILKSVSKLKSGNKELTDLTRQCTKLENKSLHLGTKVKLGAAKIADLDAQLRNLNSRGLILTIILISTLYLGYYCITNK